MQLDRIAQEVSMDLATSRPSAFRQVESSTVSLVGPGLAVHGNLQSTDDLRIGGQVVGDVRCNRLTVEKGGKIVGNIVADEIIVRGAIDGILRAKSVILQDTAHVAGDIYHALLEIEMGAYFDGFIRRRDNPLQSTEEEIVAAASAAGVDPISLKYLIRPLLTMGGAGEGDAVAWAKELSRVAGRYDSEVLSETAKRLTANSGRCPPINDIAEECERTDLDIGGQRSLSSAMYRMYAIGAREWKESWGPLPGQRGCRLRRDEQDVQWREIIKFVHSVLMTGSWATSLPTSSAPRYCACSSKTPGCRSTSLLFPSEPASNSGLRRRRRRRDRLTSCWRRLKRGPQRRIASPKTGAPAVLPRLEALA
jgi:cytoskeletal protein CcmA (bactofilin family)